jgi:DNA-binding Lrp family transcriptional regulator
MDETDKKIIEEMRKNSRISFKKLAETLGFSVDTVIRRYRNLIRNREVKASITVSSQKFGIKASVWYFIILKQKSNMSEVVNRLSKIKGILILHTALGDYDLLAETAVTGYSHAVELEKKILKIPGIYRIFASHYLVSTGDDVDFPIPLNRPWKSSWISWISRDKTPNLE